MPEGNVELAARIPEGVYLTGIRHLPVRLVRKA